MGGFAPGRGVQAADDAAPPLLLLPLGAADAAAATTELDGEVDADAVDVAGAFRLKSTGGGTKSRSVLHTAPEGDPGLI